jgi:hypothetical protein
MRVCGVALGVSMTGTWERLEEMRAEIALEAASSRYRQYLARRPYLG